jgi:alginate O-acetyltransferase complex protein AlgI
MFGFGGIVLPGILSNKVVFLSQYGVEFFGFVDNIETGGAASKYYLIFCIVIGFVTIFIKNSNQIDITRIYGWLYLLYSIIFVASVLKFNQYSEFLYFRF